MVEFGEFLMMKLNLIPGAIGEILAQVSQTRQLTQADRYGLMAAILTESITEEERRGIDRLLRAVVRKRIAIAHELSAVI